MGYAGFTFPSAILKGETSMTEQRNISVNRAHLDQLRSYLDEALKELHPIYVAAANRGDADEVRGVERVQFYITSALENLPPKQMELPF